LRSRFGRVAVFASGGGRRGRVQALGSRLDQPLYRYPFKSVDANGLAITYPEVYLFGDEYWDEGCDSEFHSRTWGNNGYSCRGDAALKIGLHELRALHLFFDFREKKLYVTAANAN
jgi:hypothetical protein